MARAMCSVQVGTGVGCAAEATHGEYCAVHVNMRKEAYGVKCRLCGRGIAAGRWHTYTPEGRSCAPKCKPKKDAKGAAANSND